MICTKCSGTGDEFDENLKDWVYPWEPCPYCLGHGEIDEDS